MDNSNSNIWPVLNNPPIIMAVFQIKFNSGSELKDFLKYDTIIKRDFPNRANNVHSDITSPSSTLALGVSTFTGKAETKIVSYTYFSIDQKRKLILEKGSLTYIDENKYNGWLSFKQDSIKTLSYIRDIIETSTITRISIRFINNFIFDPFDNPLEYFNTIISSAKPEGLAYPISKYAFKFVIDIPESNMYSIINQELETSNKDKFMYIFDIDVLNNTNFIYTNDIVEKVLEDLRIVKNNIFFENLTEKTISLCD